MKNIWLLIALSCMLSSTMIAQNGTAETSARAGIDAGNQAWIDGIKTGNISLIIATYADNAVDCGSTGECIKGRAAIERHMRNQLGIFGQANSATVKTWGSSQQGNFAYEWGQAEATFISGKHLVENYLTAWQKQPDGSWKIFRNMVIPKK
jgi:ketosteroid isomerase-like protein